MIERIAALLDDDAPISNRKPGLGRSKLYGDDPTYHDHFADKSPSAFFGFTSLGAFIDYVDGLSPNAAGSGWETDNEEFTGTANMSEALHLARHGWHDGVEAALDVVERLSLANPRVKRRKPSMAGGAVSVGRMLAGDPAHMIRRPRQPGRKVVTFFIEAGCSGVIRTEALINRAALIGAIVDMMENVGYSCTVVAVDTSLHRVRPVYQLAVTLKEAGERLSLPDMMFALGHPSFLRRMSFAACSSAIECREIWADQGSPSNSFDAEYRCGPNEFYVPVLRPNQQRDDALDMLPFICGQKVCRL